MWKLAILTVSACLLMGGCSSEKRIWPPRWVDYPFAPTAVRVHPLTHLDTDEDGNTLLICHIALLDAWGTSVQGLGKLKVSLYGPPKPTTVEEAQWPPFNLDDLALNAELYDAATQMYRLQLGDLPQWAAEFGSPDSQVRTGSIVAELTFLGSDGEPMTIRGQATLSP